MIEGIIGFRINHYTRPRPVYVKGKGGQWQDIVGVRSCFDITETASCLGIF